MTAMDELKTQHIYHERNDPWVLYGPQPRVVAETSAVIRQEVASSADPCNNTSWAWLKG